MTTDPTMARDLGRMEAAIDNLSEQMAAFRQQQHEEMTALKAKVEALTSRLDRLDGGKAALLGLLAAAATLGGLISLVFQNLWGK